MKTMLEKLLPLLLALCLICGPAYAIQMPDFSDTKLDWESPELDLDTSAGIEGLGDVEDFDWESPELELDTSSSITGVADLEDIDTDFANSINTELIIDLKDPSDIPGGLTEEKVQKIYTFTLDGLTCAMPCDFRLLLNDGWTVREADPDSGYLPPMTYTKLHIDKGGVSIGVTIMNATQDYTRVSDTQLCGVCVEAQSGAVFMTANGVGFGMSADEVHALYGGNVFHEGEFDDGRELMWIEFYQYLYERNGIDAQIDTRRSTSDLLRLILTGGKVSEIELENIVF